LTFDLFGSQPVAIGGKGQKSRPDPVGAHTMAALWKACPANLAKY
jgi:hypothetical protein